MRLCILGYAFGLLQMLLGIDAAKLGSGFEVCDVARRLATTGHFSDPFIVATGPTAHVAPLYTWLLAAVFKVFGSSGLGLLFLVHVNSFLLGVGAGLLPVLSRRVYGYYAPGVVGGVILALSGRVMPQHEAALSSVLILLATLALLSRGAIASGISAGLSILCNPLSVLVIGPTAIRRGRRFLAVTTVVSLIIFGPWILRNWVVLGEPYFIRDNFGLELYVSNNDSAQPELVENVSLWTMHPTQNRAEAKLVATKGEGPYNRLRGSAAIGWIRRHKMGFLQLCTERIWYYWFPSSAEGWPAYGYRLVTLLAIAGVYLARKNSLALTLAMVGLLYSAPFILVQVDVRYRFPTFWISALLAGSAVSETITRLSKWLGAPIPKGSSEEPLLARSEE